MTNTEYYFRYEGSLVEPPCFVGVHWRVLRLPVKISPRQLYWLAKLLKLRLNPTTCENDTVAKIVGPKVVVNRPQQVVYGAHSVVYCECINWNSTR
jgi:Eukaryotic-type carbonic anhydrase